VVIISTDTLDPAVDAEDDYRRWTQYVYSTRRHGTVWVRMNDNGEFEIYSRDGRIVGFERARAV
jgi:hypothetical protein